MTTTDWNFELERLDAQPCYVFIWSSGPRCLDNQARRLVRHGESVPWRRMGGIDFHYPAQSLALVYGNVSFQALRPCVAA
jgi:hypothetical protein